MAEKRYVQDAAAFQRISVREYFAAAALTGILAEGGKSPQEAADLAAQTADLVLTALNRSYAKEG
jgi:hypothetical protein